ncbi:MAG: hypothetical protein QXF12_02350 [Candidatus Aenigmatarchaeota archaeon]
MEAYNINNEAQHETVVESKKYITEFDKKIMKRKGLKEETIRFVEEVCNNYQINFYNLHVGEEKNTGSPIVIAKYNFILESAINNGLKNLSIDSDGNTVTVSFEREGYGKFSIRRPISVKASYEYEVETAFSDNKETKEKKTSDKQYFMAIKNALIQALKLAFPDVVNKYSDINFTPNRQDRRTYNNQQYNKQGTYNKPQQQQQQQKNANATNKETQNKETKPANNELVSIKTKIMNLSSAYNIDKEVFLEMVKEAKKFLFDSEDAQLDLADYNRLYNYLSKYLETEYKSVDISS